MADFIHTNTKGIIISTNNVVYPSNLQEIKKYVKNSLCVVADQIKSPRLPQSKSYLKIVGIPYLSKVTNAHLSSGDVEKSQTCLSSG